jgi:hypothetical protein
MYVVLLTVYSYVSHNELWCISVCGAARRLVSLVLSTVLPIAVGERRRWERGFEPRSFDVLMGLKST